MNIGIWELAIILGIVILLFGTKKLGNFGADLGNAIRGFRAAMREDGSRTGADAAGKPVEKEPPQKDQGA
jgi:sec-independent protein translocase protein TatA